MSNTSRRGGQSSEPSIAVIGAGAWGTTLAIMCGAAGRRTTLVTRSAATAAEIATNRENRTYLPRVRVPHTVDISHDLEQTVASATTILIVVPSQQMRAVATRLRPLLNDDALIVSCAKGFEQDSLLRMTQVVADATGITSARILALSGPNLSGEIAAGLPASTVIASDTTGSSEAVQRVLSSPSFRVYTSDDVVGVEFGGALKNVVALAAGAVDGMGAGQNAKAALICRGLAEITRLGVAAGANPLTFGGLSGLGDLIATCESPLSRNRSFGEQLGRGVAVESARGHSPHIVEGISATAAARQLSAKYGVEMPIAATVSDVLDGRSTVQDALERLMSRAFRSELDD